MLLSIIIPVFNVQDYIAQAIQSVVSQEFSSWELILINDGSTDGSLGICERFRDSDPRIVVIDQANTGVSGARNSGLDRAIGQFVLFLDGDDYLCPGALAAIADHLALRPTLELLTCSHNEVYSDGAVLRRSVPSLPDSASMQRGEYFEALSRHSVIPWAAWKNVFRRELLELRHLRFDRSLVRAEDTDFFVEYARRAQSFQFLDYPICNYRADRASSAMRQVSKSHLMNRLVVRVRMFEFAQELLASSGFDFTAEVARMFVGDIGEVWEIVDKAERSDCLSFVEAHKYIIPHAKGFRAEVLRCLWACFGFYKGSLMFRRVRTWGRWMQRRLESVLRKRTEAG